MTKEEIIAQILEELDTATTEERQKILEFIYFLKI